MAELGRINVDVRGVRVCDALSDCRAEEDSPPFSPYPPRPGSRSSKRFRSGSRVCL